MKQAERLFTVQLLIALLYFGVKPAFAAGSMQHFSTHQFRIRQPVEKAMVFSQLQLEKMVELADRPSRFPNETNSAGQWQFTHSRNWVSGFFPGCLWYMYEYTKDEKWRHHADRWLTDLEEVKAYTGTHDLGFMIHNSFGNAYRITSEAKYKEVVFETCRSLMQRYNPEIGCIRSWGDIHDKNEFTVIVDNMMNLEMLLWAAENGGDAVWRQAAIRHADVTSEIFIRKDGGTYHVIDFDPITSVIVARRQHQGYSLDSTWARGQAWGIYGYTVLYRKTGNSVYRDIVHQLADTYLKQLPEDHVPYWDFDAGRILPDQKKDSSAAAITASALLEFCTLVDCPEQSRRYFQAAEDMLESLCNPPYLAVGTDSQAIVLHSVRRRQDARQPEIKSHIWNEYYFIESLVRYMRMFNMANK